jgi:preprotein translocase subunit SecY
MATPGATGGGLTELWARLRFVAIAIIVYRLGAHIPVPGINPDRLADLFEQQQGTILSLFNMFSGGALERMSILALGIMPYISASIVMQLLTATVPSLEALKKEGEAGRRKITQYTRYGTVFLATIQSIGVSMGLAGQGVAFTADFHFHFVAVVTFVSGSVFLMWLGEQAIGQSAEAARQGDLNILGLLAIAVIAVGVVAFVVFMERAQRRITVNYARRQQGNKVFAAQQSHLPLKINMAGVIPPIFASSLLLFPASIGQWFGQGEGMDWLSDVSLALGPGQPLYYLLFTVGIVFFCYFYTALVFNPRDVADNLKKSGAFIPGIRPGEQSANYIDQVMSRLTFWGAAYIAAVSLLPQSLVVGFNAPFYFGGTSLLIVVVVVMDFMSQVQSHLMSRQYESLMKKSNLKGYGAGGLLR